MKKEWDELKRWLTGYKGKTRENYRRSRKRGDDWLATSFAENFRTADAVERKMEELEDEWKARNPHLAYVEAS